MKQIESFNRDYFKGVSLSIFNSINVGVLVADRKGVIQFTNPEYCRIVGMASEDLVGRILSDVRPGAILPTVIKTGKAMSGVYREVGDSRYVVDMAPIRHDGRIVGGVSIVKDITQVQKLTDALRNAQTSLQKLQKTMESYFSTKYELRQMESSSAKFRSMIALAEKAALSNANVLILGESGTGKELIAQGIHNAGPRKHGPFIPVNCAAIPCNLLESELFGYGEGAFTGARKGGKIGLFQLAHGGTLFLDEIAEMNVEMQAKLLRVLQDQKVRRVGELSEQELDVRIISATNQDIEALVRRGRFRQDLYFRLNVFQLNVPPLRERREDIVDLAYRIANEYEEQVKFVLSPEVQKVFLAYDWPGNIREMKNVIEFACNMAEADGVILPQHLPERMRGSQSTLGSVSDYMKPLRVSVREFEKRLLQGLLREFGESVEAKKKIARTLGISLSSLYRKLGDFPS